MHEHHPELSELTQLFAGTLEVPRAETLRTHLSSCATCSATFLRMSEVSGDATADVGAPPPLAQAIPRLERGASLGRYVVVDLLGEGAMGVVYIAFDPQLDRKVAVKLLQGQAVGTDASGGQAWLMREAQALARLQHPNVIAVHDVGSLPGDRIFIAMEFVEGKNLRGFLKEKPRSEREVVGLLLQAGAGLAAAHAAGLVHRDFKPDNVLVGNDGRVRVLDFGLARAARAGEKGADPTVTPSPDALSSQGQLSVELTRAGALMGTPAYMAPELYKGAPADAWSDQFAFGVTLYEALYGVRPFAGRPKESRWTPNDAPKGSQVTARRRRIAMRAVAQDPARRYPSLDALLKDLGADPVRARRFVLGTGAVLLVAGLIAGGAIRAQRAQVAACQAAPALSGVWDDARRQQVHAAFAATKQVFAEQSFVAASRALDAYARDWAAMRTDACLATRVRHEQSAEALELRGACFDRRLGELGALTGVLAQVDAATLDKADKAPDALVPLTACADMAALREPARPPSDPASRPKVEALEKTLAQGKALAVAGQYDKARSAAKDAAKAAKELHFAPYGAEARYIEATVDYLSAKYADCAPAAADAVSLALAGHRDDVLARAALVAAQDAAVGLSQRDNAHFFLALAGAAISRGGEDKRLELERLEAVGVVAGALGELKEAVEDHQRALTFSEQVDGPDAPQQWRSHHNLAASLGKVHDFTAAIAHLEKALELREKAVGPNHPEVALVLGNLGAMYTGAGDYERARAALERSVAIREAAFGQQSPKLIVPLNNLGNHFNVMDQPEQARPLIERAVALAQKALGPVHPLTLTVRTTLSESLRRLGKLDEARALLDELLASEEKIHSPVLSVTLEKRGELAMSQGKWAEAVGYYQRSVEGASKAAGAESTELAPALSGEGLAQMHLRKEAEAQALLERAVKLYMAAGASADLLAGPRFGLAQVLWRTPGDRARAKELAEKAREAWAAPRQAKRRAEVDAWLAAHRA